MVGVGALRAPLCPAALEARTCGGASTSYVAPLPARHHSRPASDWVPCGKPRRSMTGNGLRSVSARAASSSSATWPDDIGSSLLTPPRSGGQQQQLTWRLDNWITEAVDEIVRHLPEAPFLHFVFDKQRASRLTDVMPVSEKLFQHPEHWSDIKGDVVGAGSDGIILVHKLSHEDPVRGYGAEHNGATISRADWPAFADEPPSSTDVWGLVVQGRQGRHSCYILKTTRLISHNQICTRYSVTKAACFGPELHKQLEKTWLA